MWTATTNVSLSGNPSVSVTNRTINSLRLTAASTVTITAGNTLTLASGGLLVTGSGATAITNGTLLGAAGQDLVVIHNGTANMTISSAIADNTGATGLTKSGTGTLILSGTNTYTGVTTINAGTVDVQSTAVWVAAT